MENCCNALPGIFTTNKGAPEKQFFNEGIRTWQFNNSPHVILENFIKQNINYNHSNCKCFFIIFE